MIPIDDLVWIASFEVVKYVRAGNLVAVGTMEPQIEVWDLDLIDGLEPAFKLGEPHLTKSQKKKFRRMNKGSKTFRTLKGHSDAVLCLAWNKEFEWV